MSKYDIEECPVCNENYCTWCDDTALCPICQAGMCPDCAEEMAECSACQKKGCSEDQTNEPEAACVRECPECEALICTDCWEDHEAEHLRNIEAGE